MTDPDRDTLLAVLYDWHNAFRLKRQNQDIPFWRTVTADGGTVAVMGAGTGRVARMLARNDQLVIAVDRDCAKLRRMPLDHGLLAVCADFREMPLRGGIDHVIFPYSALQLTAAGGPLRSVVSEARRLCSRNGRVWIDVSNSFHNAVSTDWYLVLSEFCEELGLVVIEEQRRVRRYDHLELTLRFTVGPAAAITVVERWYWHPDRLLRHEIESAGLRLHRLRRGYGETSSLHRRIYETGPLDTAWPTDAVPAR
jgi:hypothetical protein